MKNSVILMGLIGITVFTTLLAMIFVAEGTSYLYNRTWIANGNEAPECLQSAHTVMDCDNTDEYFHGLFW